MDPQATLELCENSLADCQPLDALCSLLDYYRWRMDGGFEPQCGDYIARALELRIITALEN